VREYDLTFISNLYSSFFGQSERDTLPGASGVAILSVPSWLLFSQFAAAPHAPAQEQG
jgi:hypothetical protein